MKSGAKKDKVLSGYAERTIHRGIVSALKVAFSNHHSSVVDHILFCRGRNFTPVELADALGVERARAYTNSIYDAIELTNSIIPVVTRNPQYTPTLVSQLARDYPQLKGTFDRALKEQQTEQLEEGMASKERGKFAKGRQ